MIDYEPWMCWPVVGYVVLMIRFALLTEKEMEHHQDTWQRIAWRWKVVISILFVMLWPIAACEILWIGLKKVWGMLAPPKT